MESHRWRVMAASVCGTSHQKTGRPCQDAHYWRTLPDGVLIAAVADGAGSAALGEVGAAIAAWVATSWVCIQWALLAPSANDEAWHTCLSEAMAVAQAAIAAEAESRQVTLREFATTLILVVATPELVAVAQVGDGAVVMGDEDGYLMSLTVPSSGEYANQTTFLISGEALSTAQRRVWHGVPAYIAVFSDGLQRLALTLPQGTPHRPFFSPLFRFVSQVTDEENGDGQIDAFLRSHRVIERTDDDTTLLLATLVR